jgi:hypothetical protein
MQNGSMQNMSFSSLWANFPVTETVRSGERLRARAEGSGGATHSGKAIMPARSKSQQKAAGAALAAKRGELDKSDLKGASRSMFESMSEEQLHHLAATKRKGKPEHVSKS